MTVVAACGMILGGFAAYAFFGKQAEEAEKGITIGSKSFTESVILGEIGTLAVKASGHDVDHRQELGGTNILFLRPLQAPVGSTPIRNTPARFRK